MLIRATLSDGASGRAYDTRVNFLQYLAFEMFQSRRQVMLESEFRECFDQYWDKHQIGDLDYSDLKRALINCDMLCENGEWLRVSLSVPVLLFCRRISEQQYP